MSESKESFSHHFQVLKQCVQTLREQKTDQIDQLVSVVDQALSAYQACQQRLLAVQTLLEQRLGSERSQEDEDQ